MAYVKCIHNYIIVWNIWSIIHLHSIWFQLTIPVLLQIYTEREKIFTSNGYRVLTFLSKYLNHHVISVYIFQTWYNIKRKLSCISEEFFILEWKMNNQKNIGNVQKYWKCTYYHSPFIRFTSADLEGHSNPFWINSQIKASKKILVGS
jgi:hypothetical protein